ncbi:unnamed protein product, partial [marine sediment metagenome]
ALCVSPGRDDLHLYFRLHPQVNINADSVLIFLRNLRRQLPGPIFLIWDRLCAHRARRVQDFLHAKDMHAFFLPAYAPELNPAENVWSYLKMNPLANLPTMDVDSLAQTTRHHGRSVQRKQQLLRSFVRHSPLSLRLK